MIENYQFGFDSRKMLELFARIKQYGAASAPICAGAARRIAADFPLYCVAVLDNGSQEVYNDLIPVNTDARRPGQTSEQWIAELLDGQDCTLLKATCIATITVVLDFDTVELKFKNISNEGKHYE